jgi:hypothetical protein
MPNKARHWLQPMARLEKPAMRVTESKIFKY